MTEPDRAGERALSQLFEGIAALPSMLEMLKDQQQRIAAIQKEMAARSTGTSVDPDG